MSDAKPFFSASELAEMLAVKTDKVLTWIKTGELAAFNVASKRVGKPRWRITQESFTAFQATRSAVPTAAPAQRRPRRATTPPTRTWIV